MGITLNQVSQASGGAARGFEAGEGMQINAQDAAIRQGAEDRTRRDDAFSQMYNEVLAERGEISNRWKNGGGPPAATGTPAPQGAIPVGVGGPPPTGGGQQGIPAGGTAPPPPPSQYKTYREEMAAFNVRAEAAAARYGGLEGVDLHQKANNAYLRGEMVTYASTAADLVDGGSVGEAAKNLNTAMSVSPVDLGVEWKAVNGKLHLVGPDGKIGKEFNGDAVRGFTTNYLGTPENFLATQQLGLERGKFAEEKRAAAIEEPRKQQETDAVTSNAESNAIMADVAVAKQPAQTMLAKAQAYYALARGKGALAGADGVDGPDKWWGKRNMDQIEEMEGEAREGRLGFALDSPWTSEDVRNSELFSSTMNAMKQIRYSNNPNPSAESPFPLTDNGAAEIARMAFFNELDLPSGTSLEQVAPPGLGDIKILHDAGINVWEIEYQGNNYLIPPEVGLRIQNNRGLVNKAAAE